MDFVYIALNIKSLYPVPDYMVLVVVFASSFVI